MSIRKNYHETQIEVQYRDTDSVGHVSSPVYYEYMQRAYLRYMFHLLDVPFSEKLPHIMVKTSCEYVQPAKFGDVLIVESSVTKFGTKSFELDYLMRKNDPARTVVAKGLSTHVMFDYHTGKTAVVPDDFKNQVLTFQGSLAAESLLNA